jgi:hypothetical protein
MTRAADGHTNINFITDQDSTALATSKLNHLNRQLVEALKACFHQTETFESIMKLRACVVYVRARIGAQASQWARRERQTKRVCWARGR